MYLDQPLHDLTTPDGRITALEPRNGDGMRATVLIEGLVPHFVGFDLDPKLVFFNLKSTLAQVGLHAITIAHQLDRQRRVAEVQIELRAIGPIGRELLGQITVGSYIGKLFAKDDRRRVREPEYLSRMFGRADRFGRPLLLLGGLHGSEALILDRVDGRCVAYLALQNGRVTYDASIFGFLQTMARSLPHRLRLRELLRLHQQWVAGAPRNVEPDELLLVRTAPLHVRTVFGLVVDELLAPGYTHTAAAVLQPDTHASGDIYELFGQSKREITDIPLEFYTLEPFREHVFYQDRDQLLACLEDDKALFTAFATAPEGRAATFVVKGHQMVALQASDWVVREPHLHDFPGIGQESRQAALVERYIEEQPSYPFMKGIEEGIITSQGVLLTRYLPSPLLKRMLLSEHVGRGLKGVYFLIPSKARGYIFSGEDRALLHDLYQFGIPVFWVDEVTGRVLQYVQKHGMESGMFVPRSKIDVYLKATVFGVYGSNLLSLGTFDDELHKLLEGVLALRAEANHQFLRPTTPLALVTGGGPGAMEMGNRIARELQILSCANIADFRQEDAIINEQRQNPYIEAKMTYRLRELVERQAEFNLDFPIFVAGGIGTDFELGLEEVRRKVGCVPATPVLLFGEEAYWRDKITSRYQRNLQTGTIAGSEWVSNCFYCVQTGAQGLDVLRRFFTGTLPIGKDAPPMDAGFVICP